MIKLVVERMDDIFRSKWRGNGGGREDVDVSEIKNSINKIGQNTFVLETLFFDGRKNQRMQFDYKSLFFFIIFEWNILLLNYADLWWCKRTNIIIAFHFNNRILVSFPIGLVVKGVYISVNRFLRIIFNGSGSHLINVFK